MIDNGMGSTPLHYAAARDDVEMVIMLLNHGADVDIRNSHKETPLHKAAILANTATAKVLIDNNADVNAETDYWLKTPLCFSAHSGDTITTERLIAAGADATVEMKFKQRPIDCVSQDNPELIALLERAAEQQRPQARGIVQASYDGSVGEKAYNVALVLGQ